MSGSVNSVTLIGNLGRDVEVRETTFGKIATLAVATSESWNDKNTGERKEKTEWHRVSITDERLVDLAEKYLHKGSKVYLRGALATRKWTNQQGQEQHTTEVVLKRFHGELTMLDGNGGGNGSQQPSRAPAPPQRPQQAPQKAQSPRGGYAEDLDDTIPF